MTFLVVCSLYTGKNTAISLPVLHSAQKHIWGHGQRHGRVPGRVQHYSLEDISNERRLRPNEVTIEPGNGASVAAKAKWSTLIDLYNHFLLLGGVLYIPNAYKNIIPISSLTSRGYEFLFSRD